MPTPFDNRKVNENSFDSYEDGKYQVNGITDFFSKDTRELPVFSPQGDQMVAKFHLQITSEEMKRQTDLGKNYTSGPAMSANYNQLLTLVRAFGADTGGLPDGETTAFLLEVQDRINKAGKVQTATVSGGKGWVRFITGTTPDEGKQYTWRFVKAISVDGSEPVKFQTKEFNGRNGSKYSQSLVVFLFQLVGDLWNRPTIYDGYTLRINIVNPFEEEVSKVTAERFDKFIELFAPHMRDWNWTTDPEKSPYGTDEMMNPIVVFVGEAIKAGRLATAPYKLNDKGYPKADILDWVQSEATDVDNRDQKAEKESSQPWQLAELVELIDKVSLEETGVEAFVATPKESDTINLSFTEEGLKWAKANLAKLWDEAKLPVTPDGKRVLANLSGGEAALLETVIRKAYNKPTKNPALTEAGSF